MFCVFFISLRLRLVHVILAGYFEAVSNEPPQLFLPSIVDRSPPLSFLLCRMEISTSFLAKRIDFCFANILESDVRRKLVHFLDMLVNQNTDPQNTITVTTDDATYLYRES